MIHPLIQGDCTAVQRLCEWFPEGQDCALWIGTSPTKHLGVVFQMTGDYLQSQPVKESKSLAGYLSQALRDALGGTGRTRPPSITDRFPVSRTEHLAYPMPSCLVYLPPTPYLSTEQGQLHSAFAIGSGLLQWGEWLKGRGLR